MAMTNGTNQPATGRDVFMLLGQVIRPHVAALSPQERSEFWDLMLRTAEKYATPLTAGRVAAMAPEPEPTAKKKPAKSEGTSPAAEREKIAEAEDLHSQIDDMANEVSQKSPKAEDFASSVLDRASEIMNTVEERGHVTDAQLTALQNMADGLSRWLR